MKLDCVSALGASRRGNGLTRTCLRVDTHLATPVLEELNDTVNDDGSTHDVHQVEESIDQLPMLVRQKPISFSFNRL